MSEGFRFTSKIQALDYLNDIYKKWVAKLSKITEKEASILSFHSDRTLKDDIAHLFFWQKVSTARLEAGLTNKTPNLQFWPKEFEIKEIGDVTEANDWIYRSNAQKNWSQIYSEWTDNFSHLLELTEKCSEEILLAEGKFSWIDGYPLMAVLLGTYLHHKEHLEKLTENE